MIEMRLTLQRKHRLILNFLKFKRESTPMEVTDLTDLREGLNDFHSPSYSILVISRSGINYPLNQKLKNR